MSPERCHLRLGLAGWGMMLALGAGGCLDGCDCTGEGAEEAAQEKDGTSLPKAGPPRPLPPPDGGVRVQRAAWTPAPDSLLTRQLKAAKSVIDAGKIYDKLTPEKKLGGALGKKILDYETTTEVSARTLGEGKTRVASAARNYRSGDTEIRVKLTDTGLTATARSAVSRRLDQLGNISTGSERGGFVRGYPVILQSFPVRRVSRLRGLVGDRYLLQIMVRNTDDPEAAVKVMEGMAWSSIARAEGKLPKVDTTGLSETGEGKGTRLGPGGQPVAGAGGQTQ